jgi:hypothetical protein
MTELLGGPDPIQDIIVVATAAIILGAIVACTRAFTVAASAYRRKTELEIEAFERARAEADRLAVQKCVGKAIQHDGLPTISRYAPGTSIEQQKAEHDLGWDVDD